MLATWMYWWQRLICATFLRDHLWVRRPVDPLMSMSTKTIITCLHCGGTRSDTHLEGT